MFAEARWPSRTLSAVLVGLLVSAAPAAAEKGVTQDAPGGLAGKEYALPTDAGRSQGQGGPTDAQGAPVQGDAPVFGSGVTPTAGGSSAKGSSTSRQSRRRSKPSTQSGSGSSGSGPPSSGGQSGSGSAGGGAQPPTASRPAPPQPVPVASSSSALPLVGVGVALLCAALGIGGYLLRQRVRPERPIPSRPA